MARRGYIGGSGGDDDSDIAALLAARHQQMDPRIKMAMDLMQFGMGQQQQQAEQSRLERASEAQRALEQERNALEERRVGLAERGATEAEAARKTKDIQESMNRGEDIGYRERVFQAGEEEKAAERLRKGQEAQQGTFEKAMEKGLLTDTSGKFTTMGEEWLKDLDPQAAARLQKVAGLQAEKTYQDKLKSYKALTPKQQKALGQPGSEAKVEELGGQEIYKRMLAETQQAQPKPNLTPGAPVTVSDTGQIPLRRFVEQNAPTAPPSDIFSEAGVRIGLPSVDARDYSKFPGSVEDLIAASRYQTPTEQSEAEPTPVSPTMPMLGGVPIPGGVSILDEMLRKIRGRGDVGSSTPPMPPQGVFQPFPG